MAETIHRQLANARGGRLAEESLAAMVVPPGLSKGTIGEKYFGDTLRELASIGVVRVADGHVSLPNDDRRSRRARAMRDLVRSASMASEADTDLWEKDDLGSLVLLGARDLVRALAWFLSLDVLTGPYSYSKGATPIGSLQELHTRDGSSSTPTVGIRSFGGVGISALRANSRCTQALGARRRRCFRIRPTRCALNFHDASRSANGCP